MSQSTIHHEAYWKSIQVAVSEYEALLIRAIQIESLMAEIKSIEEEIDSLRSSPLPTTGYKDVKCPKEEAMWESYYDTMTVFPHGMGDSKTLP